MKTLGEYSRFCVELTDELRKVGKGDIIVRDYSLNIILLTLEADGLIVPIIPNGEFQKLELTDKGRELLNRGGYSNFDPNWQPNLFDKY